MAEFDELRKQLNRARAERDAAHDGVARERERLRRIAAQEAEMARVFDAGNQKYQAERERLAAERRAAEAAFNAQREARTGARAQVVERWRDFARLTDPREAVQNWRDHTPILLLPVRLETRFKTATGRDGAAPQPQLWVRIYPDDCWLDTFDPVLTATEAANGRAYWISFAQAGGLEDLQRGAWRVLVEAHGAGRAGWIAEQTAPANAAALPTKPRAQDLILTIVTETALAAAEQTAAENYWRAAWLADGDAAELAALFVALEATTSPDRARLIAEQYQPVNFAAAPAAGFTKDQINVSAVTLVFAPLATKQAAWAGAPKINIPPDRFVFIGYQTLTPDPTRPPVVVLGNPVPAPLLAGPDPTAPKAEQLQHDADGNLVVPDELLWLSDFERAVADGMGFRINLNAEQAANGFVRVLVIGLRLGADERQAQTELETLLQHHARSRSGLALVPQGTPTNNTEAVGAGFGRANDPDESFDDRKAPLFTPTSAWMDKRDGQWLAEYLGVDPTLFTYVHQAGAADQLTARAANIALWPATLGYWMETMMAPIFPRDAIEQTRAFFNRYVVGAGALPALRIGAQPYGILPATAFSRMNWFRPRSTELLTTVGVRNDPLLAFLRRLHALLLRLQADWQKALDDVSFVGKSGDPHHLLLDIVGLHPGSVEWSQRYAQSLRTIFNQLNLQGRGGAIRRIVLAAQRAAARQLLLDAGADQSANPIILDKVFAGRHHLLKGGVVDDKPLSETRPIRPYTSVGEQNYIQWLIDAAHLSLDALYRQDGFKDDKPPAALLYLLLRHALQLGYHDVSVRLHESAGLWTAEMAQRARVDDPFLHIRVNEQASESRYQALYTPALAITGHATQPVHQFIATRLPTLSLAFYLREQLAALERLKAQPTARLERAYADHVDCCSYRLDAWMLGLVNYQLGLMRNLRDGTDTPARRGVYLGAYAWLEELKPENKTLTPVVLRDPELIKDFGGANAAPLLRDATNQGYVHAPSLNHAVAAAVLRNGFLSNASRANRQTLAVNLTSERVRTALALLQGIRAGQSLADLLGYQFERGLHDRHALAEVDKFIYDLRKAFPLRGDRLKDTKTEEGVPIEAIEARNVINGLALAEQMRTPGNATYPFGKTGLPPITEPAQAAAINAEAERLLDSHDAVADLALAEGVYQAVLGNYDRVASTYDAYAQGNFPPEPDIIHTPLNGIGLTHRVALHLSADADPNVSPLPGLPMTPRAQAEPALNQWLASMLPSLAQVRCTVTFREAATNTERTREITLQQLGLQPADLLAILREGNEQAMAEMDDRLLRHTVLNFGPRPDAPIRINYMDKDTASFSVFELLPLLRNLRRLAGQSRALKASDLTLANEAATSQDNAPAVDPLRLTLVRDALQLLRNDLDAFRTQLAGPLSDLTNRRGEILAQADQYVTDLTALLARAATFVIPQAGWGFAYDFKRRVFTALLQQAAERVKRWDDKLAEFTARLNDEAALPPASVGQRVEVLRQAERALTTVATTPLPTDPVAFRNDLVNNTRPAFEAKRAQFDALQNTTRMNVTQLLGDVAVLLPITVFDDLAYSLSAHEDALVRFAEDAVAVLNAVVAECDKRLAAAQDLLAQHVAATDAVAQTGLLEQTAQALLGPDFRLFPTFKLAAAQGDEVANALNASRTGALFEHLTNPPTPALLEDDFPVDTWLYGVARVREKMHAWEQTVMFAESLGHAELKLDALQMPFAPDDRWLGLEFPSTLKLDHDRLLYTAHLATGTFDKTAAQCGLLLDEWTEIIPTAEVDTGLTFHHDRPNCEAPQSWLLVTPPEFRGAWQWSDLVEALNETLDFAKRRAIEPRQLDRTPYAPFLPATIMAAQVAQLTIAANLALNNQVAQFIAKA
jgi:hypothetical protein